jgi:hypothetical protein
MQHVSRYRGPYVPTHLVTFHSHPLVYRGEPHPFPEAWDLQQSVKCCGEVLVPEQTRQILLPAPPQPSLPLLLEAELLLEVIQSYLAIQLAIGRRLLVGEFFDQAYFQIGLEI